MAYRSKYWPYDGRLFRRDGVFYAVKRLGDYMEAVYVRKGRRPIHCEWREGVRSFEALPPVTDVMLRRSY